MRQLETKPWMPRNDPVTAALGGTLALTAALAAALGSRVAPSIFGAMIAFALAADAGLSALAERARPGYRALGLALARGLLAAGWLAFAALLLHTPLAYPDTLRALITVLIGGEAALRVLDRNTRPGHVAPGLALILFWAAAAIAVVWFGGSPPLAANPIAAIATGTTFELLGTGSSWLGSAWVARSMTRSAQLRRASRPAIHRVTRDFSLSEP
jgi:hypothetical protein